MSQFLKLVAAVILGDVAVVGGVICLFGLVFGWLDGPIEWALGIFKRVTGRR